MKDDHNLLLYKMQGSNLNFFLVFFCIDLIGCSYNDVLKLEVYNDPKSPSEGTLTLPEFGTLNISCKVASPSDESGEVKLDWYLPNTFVKTQKRFEQSEEKKRSTLVISPVVAKDTGDYECWYRDTGEAGHQIKAKLSVLVEPRRGTCAPGQYQCDVGHCIASRFRCDHVADCPGGDDESPLLCGPDPCEGKIMCQDLDFRCVNPVHYCCDPDTDLACKFTYKCCEPVMEFRRQHSSGTGGEPGAAKYKPSKDRGEQDMLYLHSSVYTIFGCTIAFFFVVFLLGIIICRLHIQRKNAASRGSSLVLGSSRAHPPLTLHDLDIYFSETGAQGQGQGQSITYNFNTGVHIGLGGPQAQQPPPYHSLANSGAQGSNRNRHQPGPPPPYRSHENLAEIPLMVDELQDDNNNGDINGNSQIQNHNQPANQDAQT